MHTHSSTHARTRTHTETHTHPYMHAHTMYITLILRTCSPGHSPVQNQVEYPTDQYLRVSPYLEQSFLNGLTLVSHLLVASGYQLPTAISP